MKVLVGHNPALPAILHVCMQKRSTVSRSGLKHMNELASVRDGTIVNTCSQPRFKQSGDGRSDTHLHANTLMQCLSLLRQVL